MLQAGDQREGIGGEPTVLSLFQARADVLEDVEDATQRPDP